MKTTVLQTSILGSLAVLIGAALWLGAGSSVGAAAETGATNLLPANIAEELRRFHDEIAEQGQRIDRLYRALEPHLKKLEAEAGRLQEQEAEDKLLALERISDISDLGLRGQGCANPAKAEFAAITGGGAVQLFDSQGAAKGRFRQPGQIIRAIAYSPSGDELLAGTESGALLVWEAATGRVSTLSSNVGLAVARVAWLGNDKLAWGINVSYWKQNEPANQGKPAGAVLDRATDKVLWQFKANIVERYVTLAGSTDGQHLVVMEIPGQPRGAFLLDGMTGEVLQTCYDKEHGSGPLSLALSPDSRTLAVGYAPYDIILWDVRTGAQLKLLKGHKNWVVSLAFSADSKLLISGAGDSTARVWEIPSGKEVGRLRFQGESTYVNSVGLSPKGNLAFALTEAGQFIVAKVPGSNP